MRAMPASPPAPRLAARPAAAVPPVSSPPSRSLRRTRPPGTRALVAALAAACGCAGAAAGQPILLGLRLTPAGVLLSAQPPAGEQPPADEPPRPEEDPAVDRIIEDLERAAAPRPAVEPRSPGHMTPARPGVPLPAGVRPMPAARGPGNLVPENTFLPSRSGRMTRTPEGQWIFTFDGGTDGAAEPAMVLLPCQTLMEMETYGEGAGESTVLTVSGIVYVYHGRNYLMPTVFRPARRTDEVRPIQ